MPETPPPPQRQVASLSLKTMTEKQSYFYCQMAFLYLNVICSSYRQTSLVKKNQAVMRIRWILFFSDCPKTHHSQTFQPSLEIVSNGTMPSGGPTLKGEETAWGFWLPLKADKWETRQVSLMRQNSLGSPSSNVPSTLVLENLPVGFCLLWISGKCSSNTSSTKMAWATPDEAHSQR